MKSLNFVFWLSVLLPSKVASVKCWVGSNDAAQQYSVDQVGDYYCVRYKYKCTSSDTACTGIAVGTVQTSYTVVSGDTAKTMATPAYSQVYMEFYSCNTDYCNAPGTSSTKKTSDASKMSQSSTALMIGALVAIIN